MWPTVAEGYLAVLLAAMAVGQLLAGRRFTHTVASYGVSRPKRTAAALIGGELAAAVFLLAPPARLVGATIAVVVAVTWSALAVRALLQRRALSNCGCFGDFVPQRLGWPVLVQDAAFVALAVWVLGGQIPAGS